MAQEPRSVVLPSGLGAPLHGQGRSSWIRQPLARRERLREACYDLCLACGRMEPQSELDNDGSCPGCGAERRADLREEAVLEQLKTIDEAVVAAPAPVKRVMGRIALGASMVVLTAAALAGAYTFVSVFVGVLFGGVLLFKNIAGLAFLGAFGMLAGVYGLIGFAYPAFIRLAQGRRALPLRWRVSEEATERSPLTGRACSGYEIGIRLDDHAKGAPGTWLLRERCGSVNERLRRVEVDPFDEDTAHFLRRRGIDPLGQDLVFFEAIAAVDPALAPARSASPSRVTPSRPRPPVDESMRWTLAH